MRRFAVGMFLGCLCSMLVASVAMADSIICGDVPGAITAFGMTDPVKWKAQTITTGSLPVVVTHVQMGMSKAASGTDTTALMRIYGTSAGVPNVGELIAEASAAKSTAALGTSVVDVSCPGAAAVNASTWAVSATLEANTTYALVLLVTLGGTRNYNWSVNSVAGSWYAGGAHYTSLNSGGSWSVQTDFDMSFEVIGSEVQPTPTPSPTPTPVPWPDKGAATLGIDEPQDKMAMALVVVVGTVVLLLLVKAAAPVAVGCGMACAAAFADHGWLDVGLFLTMLLVGGILITLLLRRRTGGGDDGG